jgi:ubiquitin-conjugating enzyme E2 T
MTMATQAQLPGSSSSSAAAKSVAPPLSSIATQRLKRELVRLQTDPPPGIAAYLTDDNDDLSQWTAHITGPVDSPFEGTIFNISMIIPSRYPMEPPVCQFIRPNIPYHPNIDEAGRICLDTLKRPPTGLWSPAVNLTVVLLSLQSLLAEPNPDDGLLPDVSRLYRDNRQGWWDEAKRRLMVTATNNSGAKQAKADIANTESNQSEKRSEPAMVAGGLENNETKGSPDPKRLKTG